MQTDVRRKLNAFLVEILNRDDYSLDAFHTGGNNHHYRVTVRNSQSENSVEYYFLKVFITNSLQVVDRKQQFEIQNQLAKQALAPKPVALSSCEEYWLEQWCQPEPGGINAEMDPISVLANALAKIHQSKVIAPKLDVKAEWLRYLQVAGEKTHSFHERIKHFLCAFGSIETHPENFCFCHNDLHHSHILHTQPLRIVDWEYSAIGNRYFDLAACAMVNEFDKKQREEFIDRYSKITRIPKREVISGVERLIPVVDFTNELWHNAYTRLTQIQ